MFQTIGSRWTQGKAAPPQGDASRRAISSEWFQQNLTAGYVNVLRNGPMGWAQRGTSGSIVNGTSALTTDGWYIQNGAGTGSVSWSRVYSAALAGYALRITGYSGLTILSFYQNIESAMASALLAANLSLQPVCLQFSIYNNTNGALTLKFQSAYPSSIDNFGTVTADLAATPVQTILAGTVGVVSLVFLPGVTPANGYQVEATVAGGQLSQTGGVYIDIGRADLRAAPGVGLGLDVAPPPPELRPIAAEQALNQRYFWTTYGNGIAPGTVTAVGQRVFIALGSSSFNDAGKVPLPVMRTTPAVTVYSPNSGSSGFIYGTTVSADKAAAAFDIGYDIFHVQGSGADLGANDVYAAHAAATADL